MRQGNVQRKTTETDIRIALNLDGSGKSAVDPVNLKLTAALAFSITC